MSAPLTLSVIVLSALLLANSRPAWTADSPLPEEIMRMRDPFKRPDLTVPGVEIKSPLQLVAVTELKLIAVATGPVHLRGMLQTPDGKTHFVAEKSLVGPRGGTVLKILEDRILVRERIANILGQIENVDTEILLSSDDGDSEDSKGSGQGQPEARRP